jgi:hypothetical protein
MVVSLKSKCTPRNTNFSFTGGGGGGGGAGAIAICVVFSGVDDAHEDTVNRTTAANAPTQFFQLCT